MIPITRGGAAVLYEVPQGLELYGMRPVESIRVAQKLHQMQFGVQKQTRCTKFDREILRDAAQTMGLRSFLTLHPAWCYEDLRPFWEGRMGMGWLDDRVSFGVLPMPELPANIVLPKTFLAVRFYWRHTFPPSELLQNFVKATVEQLAKQQPVIWLDSGVHADDHADVQIILPANCQRLTSLDPSMRPETNLAVQAAVLARAHGFIGTYGGLAQLALRFRRPVISLFQQWGGTAWAHRHLSEALATSMGIPFHCLPVNDLALLQEALPRVVGTGLVSSRVVGVLRSEGTAYA